MKARPVDEENPPMKDMQAHLKTLFAQIAECERLAGAAKNPIKRDIFKRLAVHYKSLASDLERAIAASAKETETPPRKIPD